MRIDYQNLTLSDISLSLLANELDENFCSQNDFEEFVDLGPLKSLRIFAVCLQVKGWEGDPVDHENERDIWTPFAWLQKVLKTAQNLNAIEEIVIKVVHFNSDEFKFLPKAFNGYFREGIWNMETPPSKARRSARRQMPSVSRDFHNRLLIAH